MGVDTETEAPELIIGERTVPLTAGGRIGRMRRTSPDASGEELRTRMAEDGYVYLPGLFRREDVLAAQRPMTQAMVEAGIVNPDGEERELLEEFRKELAEG